MKTSLYFFILTLFFVLPGQAQNNGSPSDTAQQNEMIQKVRATAFAEHSPGAKEKIREGQWHPGVSFGMAFGSKRTTLNISPQIGYSQNPFFMVGGGLNYNYFHSSREDYKLHYMGFHVFGRATLFQLISFQIQPELMQRWGKSDGHSVSGRLVPTILAGGGITLPLLRGGINVMFYYDVLQDEYTPYSDNVFFTIGYSFNF